jgi:hypothetical protein
VQVQIKNAANEVSKLDEANRQITLLAAKGAHEAATTAARSLGGDQRNIDVLAPVDFDMQAAWLRRFSADAESSLRAFALLLRESMPQLVTIQESRGLSSRSVKTTGVTVELCEHRYILQVANGRLQAQIAMVVRGVTLNTKSVAPAEWFARLRDETQAALDYLFLGV